MSQRVISAAIGFVLLCLCLLVAQTLQSWLAIFLPAPLIGLLLLLCILLCLNQIPQVLSHISNYLLSHMSVLFVPATLGVGLMTETLRPYALALLLSLVAGTIISLIITAWLGQKLLKSGHDE